ncbi:hypothetical protein ACFX1Q_041168 [Malus domestica]
MLDRWSTIWVQGRRMSKGSGAGKGSDGGEDCSGEEVVAEVERSEFTELAQTCRNLTRDEVTAHDEEPEAL